MTRLLLLIFSLAVSTALFAQERSREAPPASERIFFGGSFGLQFGTITNIEASPVIGFWLLPRLAFAAGPTFQYYKGPEDETILWGGKTYVQITLIQDVNNIIPIGVNTSVFVQGEYEGLSLESNFWYVPAPPERFYMGTFLAGAGISQQIGRRSTIDFTLLWTLSDPEFPVYDSPEIRITFNF